MRTRLILGVAAVLGFTGAVGIACSSTTTEDVPCDPASDPSCTVADGGDDGTSGDGTGDGVTVDGGGDGTPSDTGTAKDTGLTVYPDGSKILPDGAVMLPDGAIVTDTGGKPPCTPGGTQCTDCVDNDGDGVVDWLDPECTGPLDNDEGSFATGIPGDNIDPCKQDCWFDGNSGSGNDGCLFPSKCLPGSKEPKCPYDPVAAKDPKECPPPSPECIKYCKPLTPKGCDCAGCCQVFDPSGKMYTVKLTSTCHYESLGDPSKCPTCTQIADCSNPCGKCDWCLGKTSLPPECYPPPPDAGPPPDGSPPDAPPPDGSPPPDAATDTGTPGSGCPSGYAACSPTTPCPTGFYCLTGCCIKPPS